MWLYLFFLLPGCFGYRKEELRSWTVLQGAVATLPCAHVRGDVTWSRLISSDRVTLVTIKNGDEIKADKHYGSLTDNSLVITNVTPFDEAMYWCNQTQVYLRVTTDPSKVGPEAGGEPGGGSEGGGSEGGGSEGGGSGLGAGQEGAAEGPENQAASGVWRLPVGVVVGAALVLLGVLTLKFCLKNRVEKSTILEKTATEVTYEEIQVGEQRPGRESYFESPYYFLSVSEPASGSTPININNYNLYSNEDRSSEQCVYSLAQNPVNPVNPVQSK